METIDIIIADDHRIFLDGLRVLLESEPELRVVGLAKDGREVMSMLTNCEPDILLLDMNMPEMDGLETTRKVCEQYPAVKIIMLTMHDGADYITSLIEAGASGYLLKNSSRDELLKAIRTVNGGQAYFSSAVTTSVMQSLARKSSEQKRRESAALTPREVEVLRLIARELTTAEIGEALFISPDTVESHRKNLLSKLNKKNTAGLAAEAVRMGLV